MAVTSTQSNNPARAMQMATGSYIDTGTAAAFTLTIGFTPRYVRVVNETDGDKIEWFEGMADAEGLKTTDTGVAAIQTTLGITPTDKGFTVGLDTDINVTSEQLSWIAFS